MKTVLLSLCTLALVGSTALAGSEVYTSSNKSTVAPVPECPQWYADNEVNISLSGVYAFTGTEWRDDTYFGVDHAWGGSIDAKYFFHRYFGVGLQGSLVSANTHEAFDNGVVRFSGDEDRHAVGTLLGTFTLRMPINCSRFAPFVWVGGGGIFGGGRSHEFLDDPTSPRGFIRRDFDDSEARALGQFGGGLEVRITPRFSLISDFSWNIISGPRNNFGMARTGINFAF